MKKTKLFNRVAAIVVRDGCVLTHEKVGSTGSIHQALPGGKLEPEETALDCLQREFTEEFGVRVQADHLLYVAEGFWRRHNRRLHEVVLYFLAHLADPQAEVRSREPHIAARWLALDGGLGQLLPAWLREELPRRAAEGWDGPVRYVVVRDE